MTRTAPSGSHGASGRVLVAGAGAFGSAIALELARAGLAVTVFDPQPLARNASGIAAGMLAPALETTFDPVSADHYPFLSFARDLWPAFVADLGPTGLERCGAILKGTADELDRWEAAMRLAGARCERVASGLFTPEDWRLEPRLALAAMRHRFLELGGTVVADPLSMDAGVVASARAVVLAAGYTKEPAIPETRVLTPIKGQLLRYREAGPRDGPIVRGAGAYVTPGRDGAAAGATMEVGASDLAVDPQVTERLRAQAERLVPTLAGQPANPLTGVRAASPDGLPLIGGTSRPGVFLATGARRNGWLLAPLTASMIRALVRNEDAGAWSDALSPLRFNPAD